ncbi:MAG: ABC transporter ATP-binding protein, partial [Fervidobacterium sp.]
PEGKELYQSYTVKQLIEMTASITKDFDKNKCFDFVEKFDIPLSEKVGELSNGQTTQLYMSIVLSQKVQLYILDEPTWGLDPIVRNQILDLIRTVPLERNSVLYTSHILSEVEKIADRVAIMNKGKILEVGYLDDIKQKYCAIHVDKTKIIDGYKYKTTEKENIYIVKRKWAQENGFECEPVNFDVIFEAIVLSDKNSKDVTREGD